MFTNVYKCLFVRTADRPLVCVRGAVPQLMHAHGTLPHTRVRAVHACDNVCACAYDYGPGCIVIYGPVLKHR